MSDAPYEPLRLTEAQLEELVKGSAISLEVLARAGVYGEHDAKAAAKLLGRAARYWDGHLPVIVFPYRLPFQRDPVRFRGKPSAPFEETKSDGSVKRAKYVEPKGSPVHLYFGPSLLDGRALKDVSIPLWITEGEKKCLAAESHGLSCVAISGVTQWNQKGTTNLHPDWAHLALEGREVFLGFDRDALTNNDVRKHEVALGRALEAVGATGATVRVVRFPEDAPKLDDFLARHELSELAALMEDARKHGQLPPDTRAAPEEWKPVLSKLRLDVASSLPVKDVDNLARVLLHHPAWEGVFAVDARRETQMFMKAPPFAEDLALPRAIVPRAIIDSDIARVADWLMAQGCLGWSTAPKTAQLEQAIALACEQHRFDSVRDYLTGLVWDGVPRLDDMAVRLLGAKDTPYARTVVAKWMLSAVARVRTPGCQVDHVLVLEGPQGIGKSSALRVLAGSENFSDTVPEIPSRDAHEHCLGPWIIELAELDHMRKGEVTSLKAFISARAPSFRTAYARRSMAHPRRCVFAGTTNECGYLADATGNRRFWPVECSRIDLEGLARERDQLWAEALARVRAGEPWHITDPEVREAAEHEQAARRTVDPWHGLVATYVRGRTYTTVTDVLDALGHERGRYDQRSANRVAAILRDLQWTRRMLRLNGQRIWHYVPPTPAPVTSVTSSDAHTGDSQVIDFQGLSPVSPVSPVDPYCNTRAPARDADTGRGGRSDLTRARDTKEYTGDTGDTGDNEVISGTYPVTTIRDHTGDTGDSPPARSWRRL